MWLILLICILSTILTAIPKVLGQLHTNFLHCVKLLIQTEEKYFSDINVKRISDNKKFRKTIKPFFSDKGLNTNNMMLVEDNEIVREEEIIPNIMSNYFTNITTHLKLKLTKIDTKANLESITGTFENQCLKD